MFRGTTGRPAVPVPPPVTGPVLPGLYPDPSVVRVGTDYYLATPTFEWYPGVRVHHSRDLVHWRSLGGILTDRRLLDLTGVEDSAGVRSPCLSWADDLFHLAFTHLPGVAGGYRDPQNYVLTAPWITGPWSDPVPVHAHGADPSLFHDDDGSTWLLAVHADWRPGRDRTAGIEIQRYDRTAGRAIGPVRLILRGTAGTTGGPRLYRRGNWHYLVTGGSRADGTPRVSVARSRDLLGPYRLDPAGPLLTAVTRPGLPASRAGHGSLVATPDDRWYLAYPAGRPDPAPGAGAPGREAALQPVRWTVDGWPRVNGGGPVGTAPAPDLPSGSVEPEVDDFDAPTLGPMWSTLRRPATPDWVSLTARRSHLRIAGGQSPAGRHRPSLVARPVTDPNFLLTAVLEFRPATYRQLAGVTGYHDSRNWHYAYVTATDAGDRILEVLSCASGRLVPHPEATVRLGERARIGLRIRFAGPVLRFGCDLGDGWRDLPPVLDASILADRPAGAGGAGAFAGLWVQDIGADGGYADVDSVTCRTGPAARY
ncbi:family 43 glycosylhydrolase [Micromonospora sp. CPCC 206060]|uniref:family 43 glycosylhydrolase n=1 Tax=Micromonospora sp. CPCC 206060 TaxID=3122406 RepID=UPI002FF2506F